MTAVAILSPDGRTVTLTKGLWSETFPVENLRSRIAFYRSLCIQPAAKGKAAEPKAGATFYAATLAALEAVSKQVAK